jgi:hypothetical protein
MEILNENILLVTVIIIALGFVTNFVVKLLISGSENIKSKTNNVMLNTIIDSVASNAVNIIKALNQTVVDDLKEKSSDGKLTMEEIAEIKSSAIQILASTLSTESKQTLDRVFGDSNMYLQNVIEAKLDDMKKGKVK